MNLPEGLLISISGIRGLAPEVLTPEIAAGLARAFSRVMPEGPIVLSRDSRPSGMPISRAVKAALKEEGRSILDADLIPLPTTQVAVEESHAAGAVDVTASHNPSEYNGLKFLKSDGTFITQEIIDQLIAEFAKTDSESFTPDVSTNGVKDINTEAIEWHLERVLKGVERGKPLSVAVDAVNGAGSFIVPQLLERLGCEAVHIATDPTQPFPHRPEPLPANLAWTQEALQGKMFDLCVVVDPDADRLVLIDEHGMLITEEATIPLIAMEMMMAGAKGTIVLNFSTSRMTEDVASMFGCEVYRSAVGERNIVNAMQQTSAFFGAEGGGGIIDPLVHFGRDSLVGIVRVISLLRRTGKPLSQLVAELPTYVMRKDKVPMSATLNKAEVYRQLQEKFPEAEANTEDGLRLTWPDKWLHVRPSNTEPIFRIIVEAKTQKEVDEMVEPLLAL